MSAEDFVMPFGKYKGDTFGDILASDPSYLLWLYQLDELHTRTREAINEMYEKYEHTINPDVD